MTSTTTPPVSPEFVTRVPARRVWLGAVVAAAVATATVELYAAAVRALGIPMRAGFLGAATASPLTAASFAMGVVVCVFWGAVLATILARTASRPARTFVIIAIALTAVSLVVPAGAGATAEATKAALAVAHILVASIVIPILARYLRPGQRPGD
jgi:heme A synthase